MARDFKADQVRVSSIIANRSVANQPKLLIYDADSATDFIGGTNGNINFEEPNAQKDVWLYIHGVPNSKDGDTAGATLFGGDVVISGSLYAEKMIVEVDSTTEGDLIVPGSIITNKKDQLDPDGVADDGFDPSLKIKGIDAAKTETVMSPDIALKDEYETKQAIAFGYDAIGNDNDGSAKSLIYQNSGMLHLSASDSISFHAGKPDGDGLTGFTFRTENTDGQFVRFLNAKDDDDGSNDPNRLPENYIGTGAGTDSNFFVSGSIGSVYRGDNNPGNGQRGTAVFSGDVVISGSLTDKDGNPITGASGGSFNVVDYNDSAAAPSEGLKAFVTTASVAFVGPNVGTVGGLNNWGKGPVKGTDTGPNGVANGVDDALELAADDIGSDLYFYVHGDPGQRGVLNSRSSAAFGGDLTVTGAFHLGGDIGIDENGHSRLGKHVHTVTGSIEINAGTAKKVSLKDGSNISNDVSLAVALSGDQNFEGIGFGVFGSGDSVSSKSAIWNKDVAGENTLFVSSSQKSVFQAGSGTRAQGSIVISVSNFNAWKALVVNGDQNSRLTISITDSEGNLEDLEFTNFDGSQNINIGNSNDLFNVRDQVINAINGIDNLKVIASDSGEGNQFQQTIIITQEKPGSSGNGHLAQGNGNIEFFHDPGDGAGGESLSAGEFQGGTDIDALSFYAGDYGSVRFFSNNVPGLDTNFYVEGTSGRKENDSLDSGRPGVAVFGGDVYHSGTSYSAANIKTTNQVAFRGSSWDDNAALIRNENGTLEIVNSGSSGNISLKGRNELGRINDTTIGGVMFDYIRTNNNGRHTGREVHILQKNESVDVTTDPSDDNPSPDEPTNPIVTINAHSSWNKMQTPRASVFIGGTPNVIGVADAVGATELGGDLIVSGAVSINKNRHVNTNDGGNGDVIKILGKTGTTEEINFNIDSGLTVKTKSVFQDGNFRVSTQNRDSALMFGSADNQAAVLVRNDGTLDLSTAYKDNNSNYVQMPPDISIYFDGVIGGKDVAFPDNADAKGVATFAGDVVVSGTIYDGAGNEIGSSANGGVIGDPGDGSYDGGLFSFTNQTTIADAIDEINSLLIALAPTKAPNVNEADRISDSGIAARLAFDSNNLPTDYFAVNGDLPGINNELFGAQSAVVNLNGDFTIGTGTENTQRIGVFGNAQEIKVKINDSVQPDTYNSGELINYPDDSFGDADKGTLKLIVNDDEILSVDLTTATSNVPPGGNIGDHSGPQSGRFEDAQGKGLILLSSAAPGKSASGSEFTFFKHRTGFFQINASAQRKGRNFARLIHSINGQDRTTNYIEWILDPQQSLTGSPQDAPDVTLENQVGSSRNLFINITDQGQDVELSGIKYNTDFKATVTGKVLNYYKHVYTQEEDLTLNLGVDPSFGNMVTGEQLRMQNNLPDILSVPTLGNGENFNKEIPFSFDIELDGVTSIELDPDSVNAVAQNKIGLTISLNHVLKNNLVNFGNLTPSCRGRLLVKPENTSANNVMETFTNEALRLKDSDYNNQDSVRNAAGLIKFDAAWRSEESLVGSGEGDNTGHNTGLMLFKERLIYPTKAKLGSQHTNIADFRNDTDRGIPIDTIGYFGRDSSGNDYVRSGNPDYSGAGGLRTYYRAVKNTTGNTIFDGKIIIQGTGNMIQGDPPGNGTQGFNVFIKLPENTDNEGTGWLSLAKPFSLGSYDDGDGCNIGSVINAGLEDITLVLSDNGAGNIFTFGDQGLKANDYFILKVQAPQGWTGHMDLINFSITEAGGGGKQGANTDLQQVTTKGRLRSVGLTAPANHGIEAKLSFGADNVINQNTGGSTTLVNSPTKNVNDIFDDLVELDGQLDVTNTEYYGIFNETIGTLNFTINNDAEAYFASFPENVISPGNAGTLKVELNGVEEHTFDLSVLGAQSVGDANSIRTQLSEAINPKDSSGIVPDFTRFYRTGTISINGLNKFVVGANVLKVIHTVDGVDRVTNTNEWIYHPETEPIDWANAGTISEDDTCKLTKFQQTDNDVEDFNFMSGVKYFKSTLTAEFKVRASNVYDNIYASGNEAIKVHPVGCSIENIFISGEDSSVITGPLVDPNPSALTGPLPLLNLNGPDNPQNKDIFMTGSLTYTGGDSILGGNPNLGGDFASNPKSLSVRCGLQKPFMSNTSTLGGGSEQYVRSDEIFIENNSAARFLVKQNAFDAGDTSDNFKTERFISEFRRLNSTGIPSSGMENVAIADVEDNAWDSKQSLAGDGTGDNQGHDDGLIVYNGNLASPKSSKLPQSGNFVSIYNDATSKIVSPDGNFDYSSIDNGNDLRTYYRIFTNPENNTSQNTLKISIHGEGRLVTPNSDDPALGPDPGDGTHQSLDHNGGNNEFFNMFISIPGRNDWRDVCAPVGAANNSGFAEGAMTGNLPDIGGVKGKISSTGFGGDLNFSFGQNSLLGSSSPDGGFKMLVKIVAHKNWTGHLSLIDITYQSEG